MSLRLLMCSSAALLLLAATSSALPPIPGYLKESLADNADLQAFATTFGELKAKCDVCHKPNADKKAKGHALNDFGQAFHKHLNDKEFMSLHKDKKSAEALKLFQDAWKKTEAEKNAEGKTFGELIKAGKLPGKNG